MAEAAILSMLLRLLLEKLASGTLQQIEKMMGVRRELGKLQSTLTTVQAVLQDAEEKEVKNAALRNWLEKLKNAAYDADDVLDEAHYELLWRDADIHRGIKNKVNDFFSSHNPVLYNAKMAGKVKELVNNLDGIADERFKFHLKIDAAAVPRPLEWRQTYSCVIESEVIGREEDKRRIIEILVSGASSSSGGGCPRVLPIVGMGGIGKTTLAQMVFNERKVKAQFELCMWVCVSDDFSFTRLAKEIIVSAGASVASEANKDQLQRQLRETLGSKRYLLVLDDVWNEVPHRWEELRVLLTFGAEGSVIIVTTRSELVAAVVGTIDPYRLPYLSEDDCWELFEQKAFPGGAGKRPELIEIGKKIARRCRGLPLAAKVIGSMVHLKAEEREWQNVLNSEVWDLPDGKDWILPVLKLSYHRLPHRLKRCFAFCAIFPKDHEIEKDMLIQLWMANGFIPTEERYELEEAGEYIFKELATRSFFQDIYKEQNITICKIHDLLHDLAQSIMGKECIILGTEELKRKSDGDVRYLMITDETSPSTSCNNICNSRSTLRALLKQRIDSQIETSIISKLMLLRVLDLRNSISQLPISIDNLKHLRYLDLSFTRIETLPGSIGQLFHLQTLKIEQCHELCELPKDMRNMCNLRHVYNGGCTNLTHMPIGLQRMSNLQTLTMFVASKWPGSGGLAELKHLNLGGKLQLCNLKNVMNGTDAAEAHLGSKVRIKSLRLEWGEASVMSARSPDNAENIMEALEPHQRIKNLEITGYNGGQCPSWMVKCHSLKMLKITNCFWLEELPCLPSLTELTVENCPLLCSVKGFFRCMTCLETLHIEESDKVVLLLEGEDDDEDSSSSNSGWVGCLRYLSIWNCKAPMFSSSSSSLGMWKNLNSLKHLFFHGCSRLTCLPDELMSGLSSLKHLKIVDCISFTGIGGGARREGGGQYLTSLKSLFIQECEAFASVSLERRQGLVRLDISGSPKLQSLPDGLRGLTNVQDLTISNFRFLKTLPDWLGGLTALSYLQICDLTSLTTLPDGWTTLTTLSIRGCTALTVLPDGLAGLTGLRDLSIRGCRALTALPDALGGLTQLTSLSISECTALTILPDGLGGLTGLTYLSIRGCTALSALPDGLGGLTQLTSLSISECTALTVLPAGLGGLSGLTYLSIRGCTALSALPDALGGLTRLTSLSISECTALTVLPDGLGGLTRLTELSIRGCTALTALPDGLGGLTGLRDLSIGGCTALTSLPDGLGGLTGLRDLSISNCTALSALPDGLEGLNELRIFYCPLLATLPMGLQQRLPHLTRLLVGGCPEL